MSSLQRQLNKRQLPPLPNRTNDSGLARRISGRKRDYSPISWNKYFETAENVAVSDGNIFRVYRAGQSGPVLLMLHGGGYSGLTWSLFTSFIIEMVECQVVAVDLRGHGESVNSDEVDMSADTLSTDVGDIIRMLYGPAEAPPIVVIGHSMGGAVAVHAVYRELLPSCIGLVVIDVVEGTALDALQSMQSFLRSRPTSFQTIENAIEWCVRSGQVRNLESARVSMPGQLKGESGSLPVTQMLDPTEEKIQSYQPLSDVIAEELSEDLENNHSPVEDFEGSKKIKPGLENNCNYDNPFKVPGQSTKPYTWRIDLSKTECYWSGWFQGLSNLFLSTNVPKLLLLAGVDRLDKQLTIGQMQGKFQMQVLPQCGHAVHEDVPDKVAEAVATFLVRQKFANSKSDFIRAQPSC